MKSVLIAVVSAVQAYLLGSIDTGILVSKFLYHDDVRKYGSGAAGMTNMLRTFGKKAAALTAFGDVLKGVLAVCIGRWLFTLMPESTTLSPYLAVYLAAIFAIIGHLKPLYFGFKGGKGVLVAGGTILAIQPVLIPFLAVIFLACLLPTGMVSLGSVTMAALYPVLTILYGVFRGYSAADLTVCTIGSVIMGAMVIYMHRSNIQRIREGKEYRFGRHGKNRTNNTKQQTTPQQPFTGCCGVVFVYAYSFVSVSSSGFASECRQRNQSAGMPLWAGVRSGAG